MKSSSSTSSFEFNTNEVMPLRKCPWAAIGLSIVVCLIEMCLWSQREWFADQAAWQWQAKSELIYAGELEGDVILIGTSVTFHGIDPQPVNNDLDERAKVVNLALNGCRLQHQYQLLNRYLSRYESPRLLVVEFRNPTVPHDSWTSGPYWRFWGSFDELSDSRLWRREPNRFLEAATSRLLASYAYRRALDNWIFSSGRQLKFDGAYLDRNRARLDEMRSHVGFVQGTGDALTPDAALETQDRRFRVDRGGDLWLRRIFALCQSHDIKVSLFRPPAPSFVEEARRRAGYDEELSKYVATLSLDFPLSELQVFAPRGYDLTDFADDHHLSHAGSTRLTLEFRQWLSLHVK
jgi:hypothetical protein